MRLLRLLTLLLLLPIAGMGMNLRLTGEKVPPDFVEEQLSMTLENLYGTGTKASPINIPELSPYERKTIQVPVIFPDKTKRTIKVVVTNEKVPRLPGTFLLFSDHPEIITENGLLFSSGIIRLRPVRLNYYHQNESGGPDRAIVIYLKNKNSTPALLHVIQARSNPSTSVMEAGHLATLLFLKEYQANLGTIVALPPNSSTALLKQTAKGGELVTGFVQIQELQGHPLELSVTSEDPKSASHEPGFLLESTDPHARGAYEIPHLSFIVNYVAGEKSRAIPLGDLPLRNLVPDKPLKGTYGMIWEGDIVLNNPFPTNVKIPFYFQPRGGSATATFVLDGTLLKINFTAPYDTLLFAQYDLPPFSKKTIHLLSMPEGGSSYPVDLFVGKIPLL